MANEVRQQEIRCSRVSAWAIVGSGRVEIPIVGFDISYALNTIPVGTLVLATGIEANSTRESIVHQMFELIEMWSPVEVWVKLEPVGGGKEELSGTHKIFDGYAAGGLGCQFAFGQHQIVMGVVSKLMDLHSGNIASSNLYANVPDNLFQMKEVAISPSPSTSASAETWQPRETSLVSHTEFLAMNLEIGLWPAITEGLRQIASQEGANLRSVTKFSRSNPYVLQGLARFRAATLKMDFSGSAYLRVRVADALKTQLFNAFNAQTAWDKLTQAANMFMFKIVPLVDGGVAVPHVPQHAKTWRKLAANEIFSGELSTFAPRPMSGLILLDPEVSARYVHSYGLLKPDMAYALGWSSEEVRPGASPQGMVLFRQAPRWLLGDGGASLNTLFGSLKIPTAVSPQQTAQPMKPPPETDGKTKLLGDKLAQAMFYDEQYKLRQSTINTRFRLDIAPGSSVQVERPTAPGSWALVSANVVGVRLYMSRAAAQAGTSLQLSHLRFGDEEADALEQHPLFAESWYGEELISATADK